MPKMDKVKRIFISATGQNDGKTVVSLGLFYALQERSKNVGFIKPVGQRYVIEHGRKVDEDSVLIGKTFDVKCAVKDMSPVTVEKGFTRRYILNSVRKKLVRRIKDSFKAVAKDKDIVIIEGTGHAGVGSVFDLSNTAVARILDSKAIIIASGGIGKPIDEIMLNKALFEKEGVKVAGVIINKVRPEKYDKVNKIVRLGLKRKGLRVLGVIPYKEILSESTVRQVSEELNFKVLYGEKNLDMPVGKILIGAMAPHDAINYFSDRSLIITPGDREDMILAVVGFQMDMAKHGIQMAGIVLSGGIHPNKSIVDLVKEAKLPLLLAKDDTYSVASQVHDLNVKVKPEDAEKTRIIKYLIEQYVDIDILLRYL